MGRSRSACGHRRALQHSLDPVFVNGGHECLKVNCTSPILDPITAPFEPQLDRHVGQRGIAVLSTSAGHTVDFQLALNNPWLLPGPTIIRARTERLALTGNVPFADHKELNSAVVDFGQPQVNTETEMRRRYRHDTIEFRRAAALADLIAAGVLPGKSQYGSPLARVEGRPPSLSGELSNDTRTIETPQPDKKLGSLFLARDVLAAPDRGPESFYNLVVKEVTLDPFEQRRLLLRLDVPADCKAGEFVVFHLAQVTHGLLAGGYSIVVGVV